MPEIREIRADYDAASLIVYQAYKPEIAFPAIAGQKFVSPFSFHRMTWIKPSFLWLMEPESLGKQTWARMYSGGKNKSARLGKGSFSCSPNLS